MAVNVCRQVWSVFAVAALAPAPSALAQPTGVTGYEATSIGVIEGYQSSSVRGIDDFGRIVGYVRRTVTYGVVWINGELNLLPVPPGAERANAEGISPTSGLVVGSARVDSVIHPVAWSVQTGVVVLANLPGGSTGCGTKVINDAAWMAGDCSFPNRTAIWKRFDPPIELGTLGGRGNELASDINALGEIVGTSRNANNIDRPFLWRDGQMIDIGGEPLDASGAAYGINNFSEVVGGMFGIGGVVWTDGNRIQLPRLGTCSPVPHAINDTGLIAGESNPDPQCRSGYQHATVWERVGPDYLINDLRLHVRNEPDVDFVQARDINEAGQMAVYGEYSNGTGRGFLVTPYLFGMSDPMPGRAGAVNTITVTGLAPNQRVLLAYGTHAGAQKIRAGCPGGTLLIRDPQASPIVRADANGVATITVRVPQAARGRTFRMQAIAPFECEISHTVTWTFE